jgi:hypothetical protein
MKGCDMTDETQVSLTAGEAAKLVGKSVPTITRAIKSGKMSAKPRKPRGWIIEPSELFRVFDAVTDETNSSDTMLVDETPIKDSALQVKLEVMEQRFDDAQATIEDLRTRLDAESVERRQLTAQLTDQRQQPVAQNEPQKRGLWSWLRG